MSYNTWTTYGIGFCIDDVETNAERLLKLAELKPNVLNEVRKYLDDIFNGKEYKDEDLTIDDFDGLEGDYCERGVAYVLREVIDEIPVVFADDYNGTQYILYCPHYPWDMSDKEKGLQYDDIVNIFTKYIKILTDKSVEINHQAVENGG